MSKENISCSIITLGLSHPLYSRADAFMNAMNSQLGIPKISLRYRFSSPSLLMMISNIVALFKLIHIIIIYKKRINILILFSITLIPSVYLLKKFKLIKYLIYDDADYMPIFAKRMLSKFLISFLELLAIRNADVIVSASEILKKMRTNVAKGKIIVISNGVDEVFCQEKQANRVIDIVYLGAIDNDYIYLTITLEALAEFIKRHPRISVVFIGSGKDEKILKEYARKFREIKYLGKIKDREKIASILSRAKIALAPYLVSGSARFGVPIKIKEYLVNSLCIVTTYIPSIILFLKKINAYYEIIEYPTPQNIIQAIERAYKNITINENRLLYEQQLLKRELCREYNWITLSKRYIKSVFESLR
jgi:glycosyltransferase involved in cell wall biosynthesis